jgi:hypothetical protein
MTLETSGPAPHEPSHLSRSANHPSGDRARVRPRLAAGGTIEHAASEDARMARRIRLWIEMLVFYLGAPLAIMYAVFEFRVPLVYALQPVLLAFIVYLLWDRRFLLRRELAIGVSLRTIVAILATFVVVGGAIAAWTYYTFPSRFLAMPRYNPDLWRIIMIGYPLASVIPQELVYRTFFFHRYGALFEDRMWLAIAVNAFMFGFAHIIFGNAIAVLGTAAIGLLLAWRYVTTRAYWAVWFEHALYGCLVFTVGLGWYFFTGVSNIN